MPQAGRKHRGWTLGTPRGLVLITLFEAAEDWLSFWALKLHRKKRKMMVLKDGDKKKLSISPRSGRWVGVPQNQSANNDVNGLSLQYVRSADARSPCLLLKFIRYWGFEGLLLGIAFGDCFWVCLRGCL